MNRFEVLNSLNCSDKIEKKNGLSYLSWAWAWGEFKKKFPDSYYTIYENPNGWLYFTDGKTCWVKTGVTLVDGDFSLEHIEYLPIMDFKNKAVPLDQVDSMAVNKTVQRSLTKACARHGVGLYVYAGEDLPEESEEDKKAREAREAEDKKVVAELVTNIGTVLSSYSKRVGMDATAKNKFADEVIMPIIGQKNFKTCSDRAKVDELLKKLQAIDSAA